MIELRHLRYFLQVASLQHLTRASEALNVTQSTLSHQLRQLEGFLDVQLFDRVGRGLRLTEAGEIFRSYASRALEAVDDGGSALEELHGLLRGRLRIGVIDTYNTILLPPILAEFIASYPGVSILTESSTAGRIESGLVRGELDMAFSFKSDLYTEIKSEPLFREELVLVVGDKHPMRSIGSISASEIVGLRLAAQPEQFASRRLINEALGPLLGDNIKLEMDSIGAMLETAHLANVGALLFERAVPNVPWLKIIRFRDRKVSRTAALLWPLRRTRSPATLRLAEAIRASIGSNAKKRERRK